MFPQLTLLLGAGRKLRKRASFLERVEGLRPSGCRVQKPGWMWRRVRASQASLKVLKQPSTAALWAAPSTHSGLSMRLVQEVGEADPSGRHRGTCPGRGGGQPLALVPHCKAKRWKVREASLKWTPVLAREARRGSTKSCHCRPQEKHPQPESPVTGPRRKWCALPVLPKTDYPCNPTTENSLLSWNKPILADKTTVLFLRLSRKSRECTAS